MTNLFCNISWSQVLPVLFTRSDPDAHCNENECIEYRLQGRRSDSRLKSSWLSGASSTDEGTELLRKPDCFTILARRLLTAEPVSWCDATANHYADQVSTTGVAHKRAVHALSGARIDRGDALYRSRRSRTHLHAVFDTTVLASAGPEFEPVAAVDAITRADKEAQAARREHHTRQSVQPLDVQTARHNVETIQRLRRTKPAIHQQRFRPGMSYGMSRKSCVATVPSISRMEIKL
jgi:hypothetical protein